MNIWSRIYDTTKSLFLFSSQFLNVHRRVSFYVIVEGKEDEDMVQQQERIQKVEIEEDTSIGRMRETLDKIHRIYRKTDIIKTQWERKQTFLQDMSKMEATMCKFWISSYLFYLIFFYNLILVILF